MTSGSFLNPMSAHYYGDATMNQLNVHVVWIVFNRPELIPWSLC
jgi:hypothetical protein